MVFYKYDKESIWKKIVTGNQAHCFVSQAITPSKPVKELAFPTHELTEIEHQKLKMHPNTRWCLIG